MSARIGRLSVTEMSQKTTIVNEASDLPTVIPHADLAELLGTDATLIKVETIPGSK